MVEDGESVGTAGSATWRQIQTERDTGFSETRRGTFSLCNKGRSRGLLLPLIPDRSDNAMKIGTFVLSTARVVRTTKDNFKGGESISRASTNLASH